MTENALSEAAHRFAAVIHGIRADHLDELAQVFAPTARFKDPFNDVVGPEAIVRVFAHGYRRCPNLRFVVEEIAFVPDSTVAYFYWQFHCGTAAQLTLTGVSRVVFDAQGLVIEHVDYWDPAEQIYAKLPVLGGLFRWMRRRLSA